MKRIWSQVSSARAGCDFVAVLGAGNSPDALVLTHLLTPHELYGIEVDARLRDLKSSKWFNFSIGKVILFTIFFPYL
jgi:hypothetical protein